MFFFTIWGAAEVRPKDPDNIVVTVWGGTDILLPTLAEKILRLKKAAQDDDDLPDAAIRRTNVITLMGGTIYKTPTLAREIEQMRHLRDSGSISEQELSQFWEEAIRRDDLDHFESLTVMGGAGYEAPSRKEELKDLDRIASRGIITLQEKEEFRALLEQKGMSGSEEAQQKLLRLLQPAPALALSKNTTTNSALLE